MGRGWMESFTAACMQRRKTCDGAVGCSRDPKKTTFVLRQPPSVLRNSLKSRQTKQAEAFKARKIGCGRPVRLSAGQM